ncbi:cytochrome b/b6 domain-containing protein [Mesorhizobium sp. ESP7-2]|uniref:cytochrome b/b6 domain-containing protein n=1 Tax=unclassified Mesorhizobium TaxID=325217 RepID=UPI001CCC8B57|nr:MULTISPECIES: cytochrome b/b6 domain-containing protein [unclassified Mesorhizobium]MBZ9674072.1 cytochrome b/b6 domain-containing protein [Mesorhizobium sp. ES1-3]MBZ9711597.1 cytochrome b/b6 domain-containing protein [Mesorhizobium sp. ESP7-2]
MPKPAKTDRALPAPAEARSSQGVVRVWDRFVRGFHWALVLSFAIAWLTAHSFEDIHHWAGYAAASLVTMRLVWGVVGTPYARFSQFVRHPATVLRYLSAMLGGREARYIGHNPAGGAMAVVLIAAMGLAALTGWMMTTDAYFGVSWVEAAHSLAAHGLLVLVFLHIAGVALASLRHRENLVRAMITGRKRKAEAFDIE